VNGQFTSLLSSTFNPAFSISPPSLPGAETPNGPPPGRRFWQCLAHRLKYCSEFDLVWCAEQPNHNLTFWRTNPSEFSQGRHMICRILHRIGCKHHVEHIILKRQLFDVAHTKIS
jgi:hypothetical protein